MIHLANILIAADEPTVAQELLYTLRRHGYEGRVVSTLEAALATAEQEHPDVMLVAASVVDGNALNLARGLRNVPNCAEIPVCLVTDMHSPALESAALEAGLDDVLSSPLDEHKLLARLRPLVRLSVMHAELHRRAGAARRFGLMVQETLPRTTVEDEYPLLVVGGDSALASGLPGARVSRAADPFEADDLLNRHNFDAALVFAGADPSPCLDLCAQIRNNPRLFNLPVVVVTEPEVVGEAVAYRHGASGFFLTPVDAQELRTTVLSLVRRQRRRWDIRTALGKTLQPATRDAATGVYNRAFLDAYLPDRVNFAATHGRHLSIMFFRVPDIEGVRQHFGEEQAEHLRLQVAQWITSLLRGEDLTARYEENEFCVVLPDTPKDEADIVMHRIAGVLAYTDFAVKEVYQPVKVWVRVGAAELQPADSVEELVGRARHNIV